MSIVDATMEEERISDTVLIPLLCSRLLLLIIAKCAPSELYTWMLGQRFVGVSMLQSLLTIRVNILSLGKSWGLK